MVKPPFNRPGGKSAIKQVILRLIPEHKLYVEPFFGGGAIFWNKDTPENGSVVNDKDRIVMETLRLIKKAPTEPSLYPDIKSVEEANKFVNATQTTPAKKLYKNLLILKGTFGGKGFGKIYQVPDIKGGLLRHICEYKEMLKDTKIFSQDYKALLTKYDGANTFFFLDPPYLDTKGTTVYKNEEIDYEDMKKKLMKLKGKFMLTIDDRPEFRELFKGFKQRKVSQTYQFQGDNRKTGKQLIITNY